MNYSQKNLYKQQKLFDARRNRNHIEFSIVKLAFLVLLCLILLGGSLGMGVLRGLVKTAPDITNLELSTSSEPSTIYDSSQKLLRTISNNTSSQEVVKLSEIPEYLQHAVVAIEDSRFYTHNGVDVRGVFRALARGVLSGNFSEGASTITQQLLKNSVFSGWTNESTIEKIKRKFQEQYLALKLEQSASKDEILEGYLNIINLGGGAFGVQAAAKLYFDKDVSELTLSECTVIAGITQNPTYLNPINYPEKNAVRRKSILDAMLAQDYITQKEYQEALNDSDIYMQIQAATAAHQESAAKEALTDYDTAMIEQIIECLQEQLDYTYDQAYQAVYHGGLKIYSAQDSKLQSICDEEFENPDHFPEGTEIGIDYALSVQDADGNTTHYGSNNLQNWVKSNLDSDFDLLCKDQATAKEYIQKFKDSIVTDETTVLGERINLTPQPQASMVLMDQNTGYIKALIGGRSESDSSVSLNRATDSLRQPGSTFKILTAYAPALDSRGKTLATLYDNEPLKYSDGTTVSNWDVDSYTGPTTIRKAISHSINVVAVRCITDITPKLGFEYAEKLGITTLYDSYTTEDGKELTDIGQPLALGGITQGVSNLELCGAYATIANQGEYLKPMFFTKVVDSRGNVLLDNTDRNGTQVLKKSTAFLLTSAMKDVLNDPTGTAYGYGLGSEMPAAGKSGTTENYRDIWFVGYTPYYTCSIWGGYDNGTYLSDTSDLSHSYSKVLWQAIMKRVNQNLKVKEFVKPSDIVTAEICRDSGLLSDSASCDTYTEYFLKGTQPTKSCTVHKADPDYNPEDWIQITETYGYEDNDNQYHGDSYETTPVTTETSAPETWIPETSAPQTSAPQTSVPETSAPQTSAPETSAPETYPPETYPPETYPPETYPPETYPPETYPPETYPPETYPPETYPPETYPPETSAPENYAPENYAPESSASENYVPESSASEQSLASALDLLTSPFQ